MQVDVDPLQIKDPNYTKSLKCLMVEATESPDVEMEVSESSYAEKVKSSYPTTEDEIIDFLNRSTSRLLRATCWTENHLNIGRPLIHSITNRDSSVRIRDEKNIINFDIHSKYLDIREKRILLKQMYLPTIFTFIQINSFSI